MEERIVQRPWTAESPIWATEQNLYHLLNHKAERALCSVSGGSDSDIMVDLIHQLAPDKSVTYVFFDTGIEYEATKAHLGALEGKYGVEIKRLKAAKPVPLGCKQYGQPFLSKTVSENIGRLQSHGFTWTDEPFEVLYARYPKCKSALRWWCNCHDTKTNGMKSSFGVGNHFLLKEFMIASPPQFKISPKCCDGGKKATAHAGDKIYKPDLKLIGMRRDEGGPRATSYHDCGIENVLFRGALTYLPLFYWTDADKAQYKRHFGVMYSDCYEVYGLKRTGCAGCPFGSRFENELEVIRKYEPHLYAAVNNIFGDSYEYTRKYREFKKQHKDTAAS